MISYYRKAGRYIMNLEVLKMQVGGIKSLTALDHGDKFVVTMTGRDKPVLEFDKTTGALGLHLENFKSTGLDFGLLMMALSNGYTQGDSAMKAVKVMDTKDPNVIATMDRAGMIKATDPKNLSKDDLQLKATVWLMRDFQNEDIDPIVGVVGLARTVEKHGMVSSTSEKSAPEA